MQQRQRLGHDEDYRRVASDILERVLRQEVGSVLEGRTVPFRLPAEELERSFSFPFEKQTRV